MESLGDNLAGNAAAESAEVADERVGEHRDESRRTESPYGPGVPTAESFADDVPLEWLHEEDGSTQESSTGFAR